MNKDTILTAFISEIRETFPEVAERIDRRLSALDPDPEPISYTEVFECFSQATTDAIKGKDAETASRHLNYMAHKLKAACAVEREYIDVYYTEPLMWDISDRAVRSWGWDLFPAPLKRLYEKMWGKQKF